MKNNTTKTTATANVINPVQHLVRGGGATPAVVVCTNVRPGRSDYVTHNVHLATCPTCLACLTAAK